MKVFITYQRKQYEAALEMLGNVWTGQFAGTDVAQAYSLIELFAARKVIL